MSEGKKDDSDKAPLYLLGPFREGFESISKVAEFGKNKYGYNNWMQIQDTHRIESALFRHLMKYLSGEKIDPETNESHMAHAAWNCLALMWFDKQFDNTPNRD